MHPFLRGLRPTLHIAHRGGAALAPENTLAAFRQAVERWRTDQLELDVHVTRDGEVVVIHDETLDRCTDGSGPVADRTAAELAELDAGYRWTADGAGFPFRGKGIRIPTLREVLRAFPGLRLNVELKGGAEAPFVELLREERALDRVCIGSEHDAIGERLADALPEGCHFLPRGKLAELVMALKLGGEPTLDERFLVLDMPLFHEGIRLVDRPFLERTASIGRWVNVWTVDEPEEMRRLVEDGVGGIMTDRPDLLRTILDRSVA